MVLFSYLVSILYIFGEISQIFGVGPSWFRYHASDLGFVACSSMILPLLFGENFRKFLRFHHVKLVAAALFVAVASELIKNPDPVDLACFVAGSIPPFLCARFL